MNNSEKIRELEEKLKNYEAKLAEKKRGYGQAGRTGSGDSYTDQLRDDTNTLEDFIIGRVGALEDAMGGRIGPGRRRP